MAPLRAALFVGLIALSSATRHFVIDPEGYLSNETRGEIDRVLGSVNTPSECGTYHAAIAFVRSAPDGRISQEFVRNLHDAYEVGSGPCSDGAILCVVVEDKRVFMTTGRSFHRRVDEAEAERAVDVMVERLQYRDYDAAALLGARAIADAIRIGRRSVWSAMEHNAPVLLLATIGAHHIFQHDWAAAVVELFSSFFLWDSPCTSTVSLGVILAYMDFGRTGCACALSGILRCQGYLGTAVVALALGLAWECVCGRKNRR